MRRHDHRSIAQHRPVGQGRRGDGRRGRQLRPASTAHPVARRGCEHRHRPQVANAGPRVRAAGHKAATLRRTTGARHHARDRDQRRTALVGARARQRREQAARVRMPRPREQCRGRRLLHQSSGIHHTDPLADLRDHAEIVRDVEQRRAVFLPQLVQQIEHHRLDGDVETRRRLVEQQQCGIGEQRHRDHHALLLAAGKLVRVAAHHALRIGQMHVGERPRRTLARFGGCTHAVRARHFHELAADRHARVQRRRRLLIDDRDASAAEPPQCLAVRRDQIAALEQDLSARDGAVAAQIAHDRHDQRGLAAAGLAHQAKRLARADLQGELGNGRDRSAHRGVFHAKVADREQRHWPQSACDSSVSPSASRLKPRMSVTIAIAG